MKSSGIPAYSWLNVYSMEDMHTAATSLHNTLLFFKDLHISVPPILALFEIAVYRFTDSFGFVRYPFYQLLFVSSFFLSLFVFKRSVWNLWQVLSITLLFAWATSWFHPYNPQIYDLWFPFCVLLSIYFLRCISNAQSNPPLIKLFCFLSGMFLSFAELSRPFFILLLPVLLFCVFLRFYNQDRKLLFYFLLPVILFSGTWHLKLFIWNNQQIMISNHTGFNLARVWAPMVSFPEKIMNEEYTNVNSLDHTRLSENLKKNIINYIIWHPFKSANYAILRFCTLFKPTTYVYFPIAERFGIAKPVPANHPLLPIYIFLVRMSALVVILKCMTLIHSLCINKNLLILGEEKNILLIITMASSLLLCIGDTGEEYRFLISVLPLLAAIQWGSDTQNQSILPAKALIVPLITILTIVFLSYRVIVFNHTEGLLQSSKNVASKATVEVSSIFPGSNPAGATDGHVGGVTLDDPGEWISNGEKESAWFHLRWEIPQNVNSILLYDRPNLFDQVKAGEIVLNTTEVIPFSELNDLAENGLCIRFSPRQITDLLVKIKEVKVGTRNIGLSEIGVFTEAQK